MRRGHDAGRARCILAQASPNHASRTPGTVTWLPTFRLPSVVKRAPSPGEPAPKDPGTPTALRDLPVPGSAVVVAASWLSAAHCHNHPARHRFGRRIIFDKTDTYPIAGPAPPAPSQSAAAVLDQLQPPISQPERISDDPRYHSDDASSGPCGPQVLGHLAYVRARRSCSFYGGRRDINAIPGTQHHSSRRRITGSSSSSVARCRAASAALFRRRTVCPDLLGLVL